MTVTDSRPEARHGVVRPAHDSALLRQLRVERAPALVELGAAVPTRGLYLIDSAYDDRAAYAGWLAAARPRLSHLTRLAVS